MILHLAPIHRPDAISCVNTIGCIYHAIVQSRHDGGCLEYGSRFKKVADSMVMDFPVLAIYAFLHVYNSLDVPCRYLHYNGNPYVPINQFQFIDDRTLG